MVFPSFFALLPLRSLRTEWSTEGVCGKQTNCETVTCSQWKLADGLSSLAHGVLTEFTDRYQSSATLLLTNLQLKAWGAVTAALLPAWLPTNFSASLHVFHSRFSSFPFANPSPEITLLLITYQVSSPTLPACENRYIKHMLTPPNPNFPFPSLFFLSRLFHNCTVLRGCWVWDCWPAGLRVLPSLYREREQRAGHRTALCLRHGASLGRITAVLTGVKRLTANVPKKL